MQVATKCFVTMLIGLLAGQAMSNDLVIENQTSHKIEAKLVREPDGGKDFGYAFTIDGKQVIHLQIAFLLELYAEEGVTTEEEKQMVQLLLEMPMFLGYPNQKVVFSYSEDLCAKGSIAAQVSVSGETITFCMATDPKIQGGNVYVFADDSLR